MKKPYPQSWLWFGAGKSGVYYLWRFADGIFTIELYIQHPDVETNDYIFSELSKKKEEIENNIDKLRWYNPPDKKVRTLRVLNSKRGDIMDLNQFEKTELIKWGVEHMLKFKATIDPLLKKLT